MIGSVISFLAGPLGSVAVYAAAAGFVTLAAHDGWLSFVTIPRLESRAEKAEGEAAKAKDAHKSAVIAASEAARKQEAEHRAKEQGWQAKLQQEVEDGSKRLAAAVASRDAVTRERDGLRRSNTALSAAARLAPNGAPAPAECAPAVAAVDLLGGMFDRLGEATAAIAEHADRSHTAGLVCERAWPVNQ